MENSKRLILVMLLSMAAVFGWTYINILLRQKHPEWYAQPENPTTTSPATTPTTGPTSGPSAGPAIIAAGGLRVIGGQPTVTEIGQLQFDPKGERGGPMGVRINPRGASLQSVTLNRFRAEVGKNDPYVFQRPYADIASPLAHALA